MRRVSAVAASGGVSMRRLFVGAITNSVYGQFASRDDGTEQPTPVEGARKSEQPEKPTYDGEARLHHVTPLIGRPPLG